MKKTYKFLIRKNYFGLFNIYQHGILKAENLTKEKAVEFYKTYSNDCDFIIE